MGPDVGGGCEDIVAVFIVLLFLAFLVVVLVGGKM